MGDLVNIFNAWIAHHAAATNYDYFRYSIGGLLGAAGYAAATMPEWDMPRYNQGKIIPGIVGTFVAGMILAILVDYALWCSIIAGVCGAPGIVMINRMVLRLVQMRISRNVPEVDVAQEVQSIPIKVAPTTGATKEK